MKITTLGIDIAKSVFQLHGVDDRGQPVLRRKVNRRQLLTCLSNLGPCLIGMEACGGAHYWARELQKLGHEVRLMSPQFVKPYVKTNKNDRNDAEAICEAVARPNMRFVSIKAIEQQDIQAVHRIRARLVRERTALVNQARGLLSEYGVTIELGVAKVRRALPSILEDAENDLSDDARELFADLYQGLVELDDRIAQYDRRIKRLHERDPVCQRISKVAGVGPMTATAIVAAVGDANNFKNGRQLAAWLGLFPRHVASGGKSKLLGISKRGDRYLRTLLIHGARAALYRARRKDDRHSRWINQVRDRRGTNRACVALANKNARIIWALMAHGDEYRQAG